MYSAKVSFFNRMFMLERSKSILCETSPKKERATAQAGIVSLERDEIT